MAHMPELPELNPVVHGKLRLAVLSLLATAEEVEFTWLRAQTGSTDGNLGAQLMKLEEAGYVSVEKKFVQRKPQTLYRMTEAGREALTEYVQALRQLLGGTLSEAGAKGTSTLKLAGVSVDQGRSSRRRVGPEDEMSEAVGVLGPGGPDLLVRMRGRAAGALVCAGFGAYALYCWTLVAIQGERRPWFGAIAAATAILVVWAIANLLALRHAP